MKHKVVMIIMGLLLLVLSGCGRQSDTLSLNEELEKQGYPLKYLESISEECKSQLLNKPYLVVEDGVLIKKNAEENRLFLDIDSEGRLVNSAIPESDIDLSIQFKKDMGTGNLVVQYDYVWENLPVCRHQDPVVVMWNAEKYRLVDNSFSKIDCYDLEDEIGLISSQDTGYAKAAPNGVSWYVNLYEGDDATTLYGRGTFELEPYSDTKESDLYGAYVHLLMPSHISAQDIGYNGFSIVDADMLYTVNTTSAFEK